LEDWKTGGLEDDSDESQNDKQRIGGLEDWKMI
jgi:hypothetical protein